MWFGSQCRNSTQASNTLFRLWMWTPISSSGLIWAWLTWQWHARTSHFTLPPSKHQTNAYFETLKVWSLLENLLLKRIVLVDVPININVVSHCLTWMFFVTDNILILQNRFEEFLILMEYAQEEVYLEIIKRRHFVTFNHREDFLLDGSKQICAQTSISDCCTSLNPSWRGYS